MKVREDSPQRFATIMLMLGSALLTTVFMFRLTDEALYPWWAQVLVAVLTIGAVIKVRNRAESLRGRSAYILDALIGIPFGLFFISHAQAEQIDVLGGILAKIVFVAIFVYAFSDYYYRRHPRSSDK
ncbi:MAG: hypothetical protein Q4D87_09575 [Actinomycetaceae bacterium]|nr:hypothetical protein [Actinomycetaceae bacterium]